MKKLAITIFNNDIIVLDLDSDQYYITEKQEPLIKTDQLNISECMNTFGDCHIVYSNLSEASTCYPQGYQEDHWTPKSTEFSPYGNVCYFFKLIMASIKLMALCKKIANKKWSFIIEGRPKVIKKKESKKDQDLRTNICLWKMTNTFYLSFNKTDCLTTSVVLQHFLAKEGISSNLIIGVKTRPFISHAWLEVDGQIINDRTNLREFLSVILEVQSS